MAEPQRQVRVEALVGILDRIPDRLTEPDWDTVALLAAAWSDYHAADAVVEAEGIICTSLNGAPFQHPAVGMKNKAFERITKLSHSLGMTPQSRRLVMGQSPEPEKPPNALDLYLAKRDRDLAAG